MGINKFTSNHAVRAELGRFPLEIDIIIKTIKYWHRLETLNCDQNSYYMLLSNAFLMCKCNQHKWIRDVRNFIDKNGLNYISDNPQEFSEDYIQNHIKKILEDQYIQQWDRKSEENPNLTTKRKAIKLVPILIKSVILKTAVYYQNSE